MADDKLSDKLGRDPIPDSLQRPQGDFSVTTTKLYESADVKLGPIVKPVLAIVIIAIIAHVVVYVLYRYWSGREEATDAAASPVFKIPVENADPKLQIDEMAARKNFERVEGTKAEEYKWVDQGAGIAQIPVERAMEVIGSSGKLPTGPDWSLRPGEQMVGGVIMSPEQVQYANTPPSQAPAGEAAAPPRPAPQQGQQQTQAPPAAVGSQPASRATQGTTPRQ